MMMMSSFFAVKMEEYCGEMISMIIEDSLQLKLTLDDYGGSAGVSGPRECEVVLESWYTWPKLMVYFEDLNIDCDIGYFSVYDGLTGTQKLSGKTKPTDFLKSQQK